MTQVQSAGEPVLVAVHLPTPTIHSLPNSCVLQAQGPFLICGPSWIGNTITFPCSSGQQEVRDSP